MIRVQRSNSDQIAQALSRSGRDGLTESERAIWFYAGQAPVKPMAVKKPTKAPKFSAYKCDAVKSELERLFGGKCAYCESRYAHISAMDVEHYRPKGGYIDENGKLKTPGYYWLAAEWSNLLPSCNDCNRERKQVRRPSDDKVIRTKSGKANKFPLAPGSARAGPGGPLNEIPLLLDPCIDDPRLHLCFTSEGYVRAADTTEEAALPKGSTTIDICGLDRELLVAQRRAFGIRLRDAMQRICQCQTNCRNYPGDSNFPAQLVDARAAFANVIAASGEYQAMADELKAVFDGATAAAAVYREAVDALTKAVPGDAQSESEVKSASATLKALLAPGQQHAALVASILSFSGVKVPEG